MKSTDKLVLDLNNEPELKEHFSTKAVGDTCKFTVEVTLDEVTDEQAVLSVVAVKAEPYTEEAESGAEAEEEEVSVTEGIDKSPAMQLAKKKKMAGPEEEA